jgi:hypothetical protein
MEPFLLLVARPEQSVVRVEPAVKVLGAVPVAKADMEVQVQKVEVVAPSH